jgi:hypothetical protein
MQFSASCRTRSMTCRELQISRKDDPCGSAGLWQFAVKTIKRNRQLAHWSSEHVPFARFVPRYATPEILSRIRVGAKSAESEIPILHLWIRYPKDLSAKTANFNRKKGLANLCLGPY